MYRADAARSGYTSEELPVDLALRWTFRGHARPRPAWPSSDRMSFDLVHHPVATGDTAMFGTSADDRVVALDAATGRARWTFFTEGPVRFAPAVWRDRLFVAADDGWLYALAIRDGKLLWKRRGGPDDRKCLGNQRLISRWPARGGPVVFDDTVYFAAGIWPSDGIYLHALDPESGKVLWSNDRTGALEMGQPHGGATAKSGVAPQGYLLADADRLYVPTGRAVPAVFDRNSGELLYYHLQQNHTNGGARAMLADRYFYNGGFLFDAESGTLAARCGRGTVGATRDGLILFDGEQADAYAWKDMEAVDRKGATIAYRGLAPRADVTVDGGAKLPPPLAAALEDSARLRDVYRKRMEFLPMGAEGRTVSLNQYFAQTRPELRAIGVSTTPFLPATYESRFEVIVAGDEAVCGGDGWVKIVDLSQQRVRWSHEVEGRALGLAISGGRLLVSTDRGILYGFDASGQSATVVSAAETQADDPQVAVSPIDYAGTAEEILDKSGVREGFCVDLGCGTGELALEMARRSSLTIYGVESDPAQVAAARRRLDAAGLYGTRVVIHQADPAEPPYPRYLANLVVSSRGLSGGTDWISPKAIGALQRPFGGVACLGKAGSLQLDRRGPLEDGGSWTHQNADAANTLCSGDAIRGPLSMLWYRDVAFEMPDRHAQAPAPLFCRGCLVAEGVDGLCALDAYNGRLLWTFRLDGVLKDYDGVHHDIGVGDTGSNYCLCDDSVYVRSGDFCVRLDLAGGRELARWKTPVAGDNKNRAWGYLACHDGVVFGTVSDEAHRGSPRYGDVRLFTESVLLFALDAQSGRLLWQYKPRHSIRNNAIAIAGGRIYLIDRPLALQDRIDSPTPNGKHRPRLAAGEQPGGTLLALDAQTGTIQWQQDEDIFGTQLGMSVEHGVIVMYYQAVRHNFFRLPSEVGGRMAAFVAATGERLWDQPAEYTTRPILNGQRIIAEGGCWELKTGKPLPLRIERSYGCGQFSAGANLVLFRSATLGYHDLSRDAGTENFGGMRPGCWFNAIAAGGLVLVPDASAKCACSYPMQAWFALQGAD
ncbi:MAG: PQQ-binding-like beta-propeller repeat protein [Rhodopirellula sp.]|nr:PQQ-binding-like beta-propeller repeat protein [Rhodopirellula sp.]